MQIRMTWPMYRRGQVGVGVVTIQLTRLELLIVSALLLRRGQYVDPGALLEAVYDRPDTEPESAIGNLRVFVSRLRRKGGAYRMSGRLRLSHSYQVAINWGTG